MSQFEKLARKFIDGLAALKTSEDFAAERADDEDALDEEAGQQADLLDNVIFSARALCVTQFERN